MLINLNSCLNQVKLVAQFLHHLSHCAALWNSLPRATLTLSLANALEAVQRKRSQLELGSNFTWGIYADLPSTSPLPHPLPAHLLLSVSLLLSLCPFTSVLCVCRAGLIKVSQPQPAPCRNYCHSCKNKEKEKKKKEKQNKARSDAWARGARVVAKLFTIRNCRPFWYWINMLNAQAAQLAHCTSCRHLGCLSSPVRLSCPVPVECNCTIPSIVHKMLAQNAA